jgi:flagellar export protein FliJ
MKEGLKGSLKRLDRLVHIRQTYVSVAEAAVKQAEVEVRRLQQADSEIARNIQRTQAGIAYLQTATSNEIQTGEKYIQALKEQRKVIHQSLAVATGNLEKRRLEWTEAMKEQRILEKLRERRLHQWEREDDVANQKTQDDVSIGRHVRTRKKH